MKKPINWGGGLTCHGCARLAVVQVDLVEIGEKDPSSHQNYCACAECLATLRHGWHITNEVRLGSSASDPVFIRVEVGHA